MKILKAILLLSVLLAPVSLGAQTRPETNLFKKTMKKPSVKAADKFLGKYPESVYAPAVLHMKDSLLQLDFVLNNISRISKEDALGIAGEAMDATGWKKDGKEQVLALYKDLTLRILSPGGEWEDSRSIPVYSMEEEPSSLSLVLPMEVISPLGGRRNYIHFGYCNGDAEYVEVLYLPEEDILQQVIFYGNPIPGEGLCIEGQSPEMMEGLVLTPEQAWLVQNYAIILPWSRFPMPTS